MQTSLARRQRHRRRHPARTASRLVRAQRIAHRNPASSSSSIFLLRRAWSDWSRSPPPTTTTPGPAGPAGRADRPRLRPADDRLATGPARSSSPSLGELKRELVTFDELPPELLDATTAIEDKDFWDNPGFDVAGFVSATIDTLHGRPRGGSTITQQLVRARLLPAEAFDGSREERKIREIIQSLRLTQAYPGETGKQQIITAYLNQNFYGNQSYGVKAAAHSYFGKDLKDLTLAQDGDPRGDPPVADEVRPRAERRGGLRDTERRPGRLHPHEDPARRPGHDARSSSAATTSST